MGGQSSAVFRKIRRHRLFKEENIFLFAGARHFKCRRIIPCIVRINAQRDVRPDRFTNAVYTGDILFDGGASYFNLNGLKAHVYITQTFRLKLRNPLSFHIIACACVWNEGILCSAEQLIHRHARLFSKDIPQRNVDRTDGRHHNAASSVSRRIQIHAIPQRLDHQRILSDKQRPKGFRRQHSQRFQRTQGESLSDSRNSLVSFNLNQKYIAGRNCRKAVTRRVFRPELELNRLNLCNNHIFSSPFNGQQLSRQISSVLRI